MNRFILASLSVLLIFNAIAPAANAKDVGQEQTSFNPAVTKRASTSQLTPFNLAYLAYQGYFRDQGLPSYAAFISAHQSGTISAKDIVQIAVKANLLPEQTLADQGYLSAVEDQLIGIEKD